MRTLLPIVAVVILSSCVFAADCGNDATPEQIAGVVADALRNSHAGNKPLVADAEVAQAIHRAIAGAVYGSKEIDGQRPFRAVRSGEFWVVYGCLPRDMLGGVAVTVIRASNGEIVSIMRGQ
jgi:hypothetical protein